MARVSPSVFLIAALTSATIASAQDVAFHAQSSGPQQRTITRQGPLQATFSFADAGPVATATAPAPRTADEKIHPDLKTARTRGERLRVIIELPEHLSMPSFPSRDRKKPLSDPANQAILRQRSERSEQVLQARVGHNGPVVEELKAHGVVVIEQFWITNSILVDMPAAAVDALAARADVLSLSPERTTVEPPTVRAGRDIIQSDYNGVAAWTYFYDQMLIALLDTGTAITAGGVPTHTLFDPPTQIVGYDCVNGTSSNCTAGINLNPRDDCWNHGISSTGILTGNNSLGDDYHGVTNFVVHSFKVYDQNGTGTGCTVLNGTQLGLNVAAAQRGFQAAINLGIEVIVAEIQDWKGSVLTTAADNAFNAGCAVIAAAGNAGPNAGTVRSPGEAHKAIAVGAVDYLTLATETYSGRGPESDGRIKPDIMAPTNTWTASNTGFTALRSFGGTSGATPYGGAAASLFWWTGTGGFGSPSIPGVIYAQLINYGNNVTNPTSNNNIGAGLIQLQNGQQDEWWGEMDITNGLTLILNLTIYNRNQIDVSIWWPEPTTTHNNIDVRLRNPSGTTVASSLSVNSVFEKLRYTSFPLTNGGWTARFTGTSVSGTQKVYYAVRAK